MSVNNEGTPAPGSEGAQALAELEKEGHTVEGAQPATPAEAPKAPETPKEEVKAPEVTTPEKPDRSPTMVEAWKLKVAEDQKAGLEKDLTDLKAKVEELSKQKAPVTQAQEKDIADEIKAIAEGREGVDVELLTKFADTILKKAEAKYKPSAEIEKTLGDLKAKQQLDDELAQYSQEFEKDVLPLIKDMQLSDAALSELKSSLKDLAFSETYAKVPLKEIFQIKQETLNIKAPKKSSEGKGPKSRANEVVDLENLDEESFRKLPDDAVMALADKNSGTWNTNKK